MIKQASAALLPLFEKPDVVSQTLLGSSIMKDGSLVVTEFKPLIFAVFFLCFSVYIEN